MLTHCYARVDSSAEDWLRLVVVEIGVGVEVGVEVVPARLDPIRLSADRQAYDFSLPEKEG